MADKVDSRPHGELPSFCEHVPAHKSQFVQVGKIHELIPGRLFFTVHSSDEMSENHIREFPDLFFFSSDFQELYDPFCLDFGPVNLSVVHDFINYIRTFWYHRKLQGRELVYYCDNCVNNYTNCAFLLAAFMMIELNYTPMEAWHPFGKISQAFATFRDATFSEQTYHLTIQDCLRGLHKAMKCNFYNHVDFNSEEYKYLDFPGNADMHFVSPKFVAFKGPTETRDNEVCTFTPKHFSNVFRDAGVTAVVRLNEPNTYAKEQFESEGFRHYDLYFDDCTLPSKAIIDNFLSIAEKEEGMVAVHCKAGLGRTGTLIAIYFMKHFGWTASECIGWMRIVRPGSIIGPQQHYLHVVEKIYRQGANPSAASLDLPYTLSTTNNLETSEAMGREVAEAQRVRQLRCIQSASAIYAEQMVLDGC